MTCVNRWHRWCPSYKMCLCWISETWLDFRGSAEPWTQHFDSSRFAPAPEAGPRASRVFQRAYDEIRGCETPCRCRVLLN